MQERELRDLIAEVKTGRLSRRAFVQKMIAVGLTAPMAGMILSHSGVAMADSFGSGFGDSAKCGGSRVAAPAIGAMIRDACAPPRYKVFRASLPVGQEFWKSALATSTRSRCPGSRE